MSPKSTEGGCPDEIKMFTFTIMGVRIGVDAEQVAEVMVVDAAEARGMPVFRFDEMIPFSTGPVEYRAPMAMMIRASEPYFVIIDRPDDIALISVRSIQPLPAVLIGTGSPPPLWGAVVEPEGILLLVDFSRIH
jgi:hypothetical protein